MSRADGSLVVLQGRRVESFLADGALDPNTPPSRVATEGRLYPVADGKTFVLGFEKLTRFDADGSVDKTFGGTGTIKPPSGAAALVELGSGKIAVVSTEVSGTHTIFASVSVELLNQDGSVSAGEGFSSSVTPTGYGVGSGIGVPEISPLADGGALVVGSDFLLELGPDGAVNRGFGDGGVVREAANLVGAHVLPDGAVEAVGTAPEEFSSGSEDLALLRFTAAGQPDPGFGPKGIRRFDLSGGQDEAKVASWGADGSVIVGGHTRAHGPCPEEECEEAPVLVAFNPAGELETGFGQGGALRLASLAGKPNGYSSEGVTAMTRRPDGSMVAAGNAPPNETTAFLAAVTPRGGLVPSFGEGGIAIVRAPLRASQEVAGLAPLPDGKLLAAGTTDVGIADQPILIRYGANDSLDRSFGGGSGYAVLRRSHGSSPHGATGFAVRGDEVLTGVYGYPLSRLLMARADDGAPLASFGTEGSVELPHEVRVASLAFAGDGDPLVLGVQRVAGPASGEPGVVLRYRPDGSPDKSFARGGRLTMELGGHAVRGKALLAGPGERILAAGSIGRRFAMTSLLPNGRPDPRFGSGGWSIVKLGAPTHYLALKRAGSHIYLAGTIGEERSHQRLVLMRFDSDGRLDRSFGRRGILVASLEYSPHPTAIQPTKHGVLVVLSGGLRPLLTFGRGGKVRRQPVGARPQYVGDVRATVSRAHLVLGWSTYSRASKAEIYHLSRRPLDR